MSPHRRTPRLPSPLAALATAVLLATAAAGRSDAPPSVAPPAAPSSAAGPTVRPGSVVRWPDADRSATTECRQGESRSEPLWGTCFYPIDLATPPGELELVRVRHGREERRTVRVGDDPYPTQELTVDDSQVNLSPADEARAAREQAHMVELFDGRTPRRFALPLRRPLEPLPAAGRFGSRRIFNGQPRSPHTGADYAAKTGTRVHAVADGTVVLTASYFFPGNAVIVDHGDGLFSMYFHLSKTSVREGEKVSAGQAIGAVGATGRVTGPHLHLGIRWRGARVDPEVLLGREASTTVD